LAPYVYTKGTAVYGYTPEASVGIYTFGAFNCSQDNSQKKGDYTIRFIDTADFYGISFIQSHKYVTKSTPTTLKSCCLSWKTCISSDYVDS
jgi:hypothetical protein